MAEDEGGISEWEPVLYPHFIIPEAQVSTFVMSLPGVDLTPIFDIESGLWVLPCAVLDSYPIELQEQLNQFSKTMF